MDDYLDKYRPERDIRTLYKYCTINKYIYDLLINNELHFTSPDNFNDPFDSKPNLKYEGTEEIWSKYLLKSGYNINQVSKCIELLKSKNFRIDGLEKHDEFHAIRKGMFACCFSKQPDKILMWSHYTNMHKGICIGFKTVSIENNLQIEFEDNNISIPNIDSRYLPVFKVDYKSEMPEAFNILNDDNNKFISFCLTKHINWSYEEEYRILLLKDQIKNRNLRFKKSSLSEIIFGLNCDVEDIKTIKKVVNENYLNYGNQVSFYKAEPLEGKYAVRILPEE